MELHDILAKLEQSNEYKDWQKEHAKAYLAHAFVMLDEQNTWQIGYFDEQTNTMTTFVANDAEIKIIPDQEVLKVQQHINKLSAEDVVLTVKDALEAAQKVKSEHYQKEIPAKTFFIIQNLEEHGAVFNITYFTVSFKTINIKLSTKNGEVLHHSIQTLATFG